MNRRLIYGLAAVALSLGIAVYFIYSRFLSEGNVDTLLERDIEKQQKWYNDEERAEKEFKGQNPKEDSLRIIEAVRQQAIFDSIAGANKPNYSNQDVIKMVKNMKPSYSTATLWKNERHEWVALYTKEIENNIRYFIREFNPQTKVVGKEVEVLKHLPPGSTSTTAFPEYINYVVKKNPEAVYFCDCRHSNHLSYKINKDTHNRWTEADSIPYIMKDSMSPSEKRNMKQQLEYDMKERVEDTYYEDAEDLYFFNNGEY